MGIRILNNKYLFTFLIFFCLTFVYKAQVNLPSNQVVLQGFWWDFNNLNYPQAWSNYLADLSPRLKAIGIDAIWIPPSIKNKASIDMGYAPFDHYDLGDKYQKGFLKTKLGDKDELLRCVAVMKANGIDVIQDIVLNHITGAGSGSGQGGQDPVALDDGSTNKFKNFRYTSFKTPAYNETSNNYLAREGRFSKNWQNFYPNNSNMCCTNEINSPYWGPDISYESDAFGLSSNAIYNPFQGSNYMRDGMRNWIMWYKKQVGWSGVRLDAIKHFPTYVAEDYLWNLQHGNGWASESDQMYAVGEWVGGANELDLWCNNVQNRAGTFDFALRNALVGIVQGNGSFDLSTVPSYQQLNRQRTVPFVNNHDTFRPVLDSDGNYIGWNTGQQLGAHIEPNDSRLSLVYAISFSLDGSPMVFFEDLFNVGYNSNRYNHLPKDTVGLPMRDDIVNIIWCHQNLHFKDGAYIVRWQENDALVIERDSKALIAVNDQFSNWKNLNGVQTSWPDGTVLKDYSQANVSTVTVYGGGKVDIAIPPCNGSANNGRKGYCIWAPTGIQMNYLNPSESITQEWEMADDLGDSHPGSLKQGGALPDQSRDCRVVGKVHVKDSSIISVELYPELSSLSIDLILLDGNCNPIDSISGTGNLFYDFYVSEEDWYTIRVRNSSDTQDGQGCWVKVNYNAPSNPDLTLTKDKCACQIPSPPSIINSIEYDNYHLYPNPVSDFLIIENENIKSTFIIYDLLGKQMIEGEFYNTAQVNVQYLDPGQYFIKIGQKVQQFIKL